MELGLELSNTHQVNQKLWDLLTQWLTKRLDKIQSILWNNHGLSMFFVEWINFLLEVQISDSY